LLSSGASGKLSSAPDGACADAKIVSVLREGKEGTSAVSSWSCGTVCAKVAEAETPWMRGAEHQEKSKLPIGDNFTQLFE
jgi:hypothetical protein